MTNEEMDQFEAVVSTVLKGVKMFSDPDLPLAVSAIELQFEAAKFDVWVESEDDTLVCACKRPTPSLESEVPTAFWHPIIGMSLVRVWSMTNDRGYRDGLLLAFRELVNAGAFYTIKLYGEGSQITVSELQEVRRVSIRRET